MTDHQTPSPESDAAGRIAVPPAALLLLLVMALGMILWSGGSRVEADNNAWQKTAHGSSDTGANYVYTPPFSDDSTDTRSCRNCHVSHASWNDEAGTINGGTGYDDLGMLANDLTVSGVCYACHTNAISGSAWPGRATYDVSKHRTDANAYWPGVNPPARLPATIPNICTNCHNPHGRTIADADNLTHAGSGWTSGGMAWKDMLIRQEEYLCLNCHDGSPANPSKNISTMLGLGANTGPTAYYSHPIRRDAAADDRTPYYHLGTETGTALTSANRHSECEDCHNPHMAGTGTSAQGDSRAGAVLTGAWGVSHGNWPAPPAPSADGDGANYRNDLPAAPTFTAVQMTTSLPEYFLCLRCHSSYSQSYTGGWPSGASPNLLTDVSTEINPNNLAHHAVAAKGANQSALWPDTTFVNGWSKASLVTCSDCHRYVTSANPKGPHGSANQWILDDYDTTAVGLLAVEYRAFCFNCHNHNVYYKGLGGGRVTHTINGAHESTDPFTGIFCMNCHGGRHNGGMHGTNWGGFAATGATSPGTHFMNGSAMRGFTHDDGGGSVRCWTDNNAEQAANPYNTGCGRGHGNFAAGFTAAFNYP